MILRKRELVSFSGECTYQCKHCFAFDVSEDRNCGNIAEIIDSLREKDFDVVYLSHYRENFIVPEQGLSLCEKIFYEYKCDICIITRSILKEANLERLIKLNSVMNKEGKNLYVCSSIPALYSYEILENRKYIPTPFERIAFLQSLSENGIWSLLTIRPLLPDSIIPLSEAKEIINLCKNHVDAVMTSGLAVTDKICKRLGIDNNSLNYDPKAESEYLIGTGENVRYVDVRMEINELENYCKDVNLPFFAHSMTALNYLRKQNKKNISNNRLVV